MSMKPYSLILTMVEVTALSNLINDYLRHKLSTYTNKYPFRLQELQ